LTTKYASINIIMLIKRHAYTVLYKKRLNRSKTIHAHIDLEDENL